jgi:hypothetical protein
MNLGSVVCWGNISNNRIRHEFTRCCIHTSEVTGGVTCPGDSASFGVDKGITVDVHEGFIFLLNILRQCLMI